MRQATDQQQETTEMSHSIERFADYCAPSAMAAIMDCSKLEAAAMLDAVPHLRARGGSVRGTMWSRFLTRDLRMDEVDVQSLPSARAAADRYATRRNEARRRAGWTTIHAAPLTGSDVKHLRDARPTVAAVLRDLPTNWTGIITTTRHTLAVVDGVSRDNQSTGSRRARVESIHTLR